MDGMVKGALSQVPLLLEFGTLRSTVAIQEKTCQQCWIFLFRSPQAILMLNKGV